MTSPTALPGRVALVTGAGRGLGRAHALALAQLGATVVVNDVGAAPDGTGRDPSVAQSVVDEIIDTGGRAILDVRDIASIDGGRDAVTETVRQLGRVDIVVNNAGFASGGGTVDAPVEAEIDALLAVHLKAALGTMAAAFAFMRTAGYGRIINTVSEASLDARFVAGLGYGIAKAALWSATLAAAAQGAPYGITVNAISPGARTRMNAELLDAGFRDGASAQLDLSPEHVARVVAYLASPEAGDINGRIIHAAAGTVREYSTQRSGNTSLIERLRAALSPEDGTRPVS